MTEITGIIRPKYPAFEKLDEKAQRKEINYVYGICTTELSLAEQFLKNFLRIYKYRFEPLITNKNEPKKVLKAFERHLQKKATLGYAIKEFKKLYNTKAIDDELIEILKIRNLLTHEYWSSNFPDLNKEDKRHEIYNDLLSSLKYIGRFKETIQNLEFDTNTNPVITIRPKKK